MYLPGFIWLEMESNLMPETEDWSLALRAAGGDMDAFTLIVERYQKPIVQFCWRMTGSRPDAEDIAQETFVRLYKALGRLRPEQAFPALLFSIARNATLNYLRGVNRHRRRVVAFTRVRNQVADALRPDRKAQARDIAEALEAALAALPPEYREAIVLREYHGFDYQHIAAILACPVGTVRSRIARAREQLRQHLLTYGEDVL